MQLWQIFNDETIVNFGCTTSHCNGEQRKIYQTEHYSVRFVMQILFFFSFWEILVSFLSG